MVATCTYHLPFWKHITKNMKRNHLTVQPQPGNFQHSLIFKKRRHICYNTYLPQGDFSRGKQVFEPSRQHRQPGLLAYLRNALQKSPCTFSLVMCDLPARILQYQWQHFWRQILPCHCQTTQVCWSEQKVSPRLE